jgi:hypothetical protein
VRCPAHLGLDDRHELAEYWQQRVGGELDPAGALGRVGSEAGHIIGRQGARKRVGGEGLVHLRVASVPDGRVRLCWRAHELDGVGRQVAVEAALEGRAVEGRPKLVNQCPDRVDELGVLCLHALQLFARPILRPLPLRRLLDQLVLRRVRGDRGLVLYHVARYPEQRGDQQGDCCTQAIDSFSASNLSLLRYSLNTCTLY